MGEQYHTNGDSTASTPLFSIVRNEVIELVKPSKPTPSNDVLSFSSIDNNAGFDTLTPTIFVYSKKSYSSSTCNDDNGVEIINHRDRDQQDDDPACVIREALSKALVYYYPLAGRLKRHEDDGKLRLTCNANGVPFLVATADCSLSSLNFFDGIDLEAAKEFVFCSPPPDCPLVFQVTKFSCGGFSVGLGLSHSVCDGFGASQFLKAVAELSSGRSEPTVKPVWERELLLGKPTKESLQELVEDKGTPLALSPYLPTSDISHECFSIKSEGLKRLKDSLSGTVGGTATNNQESFTTVEALGAFVWRARLRALELNPNGKTLMFLSTGIRKLLNPPLPEGYYGNAFISTVVELSGKDLNEQPLVKTAELIKERKRATLDGDFVKKYIDTLETLISTRKNVKIPAIGALMVLTDWRNLDLVKQEIGFVWEAVNVTALPWDMFGYVDLVFILPPSKFDGSMKGGVRIMVSLPRPTMAKFKEEISALNVVD